MIVRRTDRAPHLAVEEQRQKEAQNHLDGDRAGDEDIGDREGKGDILIQDRRQRQVLSEDGRQDIWVARK